MENVSLPNFITTENSRHKVIYDQSQFQDALLMEEFALRSHFQKAGNIVATTTRNGDKTIKLNTCPDWTWMGEAIYIILIDRLIVKIGGTGDKKGVVGRFGSYSAGTEANRKRGTASVTNYITTQSCLNMLEKGAKIEVYAAKIPGCEVEMTFLGMPFKVQRPRMYHTCESKVIKLYEEQAGRPPFLSLNKE